MNQPNKSIKITNISEFILEIRKCTGRLLLYRGLAAHNWKVTSSAYRRLDKPSSSLLKIYVENLLNQAKLNGFQKREDREFSDLELLANLQHHGAATCLIDFTTNSLIALWFACFGKYNEDGKVVVIRTGDSEKFSSIAHKDLNKPMDSFLNGEKLWKWQPSHLSNRITSQQSYFVFGRDIENSDYEIIYEIIIDSKFKKKIITDLKNSTGISENYLFSDFYGFSISNACDKPIANTEEDYFYMALEFDQEGKFEEAHSYYNLAIKINPKFEPAYYNRGNVKKKLGDHEEAMKDYDEAIKINPKFVEAYCNRGYVKKKLGDHKGAMKDYDKAIEINPKFVEAYCNRGNLKQTLGDHKGAMKDYDKAIEINPKFEPVYYNRGNVKKKLGDHKGAMKDYDKAIEINPKFVDRYTIIVETVKKKLGDHKGAMKDYDKAIEINPKFEPAYYNRGNLKQYFR